MTDTGLFSGIYQGIRDHADLLDRVLVRLNAGTSTTQDEDRRRLAAWLCSLGADQTADASAAMIRVLLRGQGAGVRQGWGEVGELLRLELVGPPVIDRLEELARALEREQATVLARLRGGA
ncbi:MAG: hypothetical protein K8U57_03795 [Planctomycetes bacterium]|nr:hypothetical protein [Planctomycetota bacterium]